MNHQWLFCGILKGEDGDGESLRVSQPEASEDAALAAVDGLLSARLSPAGGSIEPRRGCDDKTDGLTYF